MHLQKTEGWSWNGKSHGTKLDYGKIRENGHETCSDGDTFEMEFHFPFPALPGQVRWV